MAEIEFESKGYWEIEGRKLEKGLEELITDTLRKEGILPEFCYVSLPSWAYETSSEEFADYELEGYKEDRGFYHWSVGGNFYINCLSPEASPKEFLHSFEEEFVGSFYGVGTYIEDDEKIIIDSGDLTVTLTESTIKKLKKLKNVLKARR